MNLNSYFKLTSYSLVACGATALLVTKGIDLLIAGLFFVFLIIAFRYEGSKWQISERAGLVLIVFSLPLFYFDWQFQNAILPRERAGAATLAHLILGLSAIKLWQKKNDRDWIFLYLISFFEMLLAAGLSISPLFLGVLILFLFFAVCTIIVFEIRKSERNVKLILIEPKTERTKKVSFWQLPVAAIGVLSLITAFAVPLFLAVPRVGGAGIGRNNSGMTGFTGFSDKVELGEIGSLQQNNQVVMRVRVEEPLDARNQNLRWRGVTLDSFDNRSWKNTTAESKKPTTSDGGFFRFGMVDSTEKLTIQTFYLEPINTPVLFGAKQILAVQGNFQNVFRDSADDSISTRKTFERISYKIYSDTSEPEENALRQDRLPYSAQYSRYLQLPPKVDQRIERLTRNIIEKSGAGNRYDAARVLETYLQTDFGYTLEQKSGGEQPLADFLFNVREGHCEYFATALAIMLRTQGIAARVVNGFQAGNYNDAADAYIVTQGQAHSWVEVYFPETDSWVTFDPTPADGRNIGEMVGGNFITAGIGKYLEALEIYWLQYVVGYDNQEQRALTRNLKTNFIKTQQSLADFWNSFRENAARWISEVRGEKGTAASLNALGKFALGAVLILASCWFAWRASRNLRRFDLKHIIKFWVKRPNPGNVIRFYERMNKALNKRGLRRQPQQTPLEFAYALSMPEAVKITEAYQRVRFGRENLSSGETTEIENWLANLENS